MAAFYLQADVAQAMVPHLKGLVLFFWGSSLLGDVAGFNPIFL